MKPYVVKVKTSAGNFTYQIQAYNRTEAENTAKRYARTDAAKKGWNGQEITLDVVSVTEESKK